MVDEKTLRPVLGSILRGYNKSRYARKTIYYKHLSLLDFCDIQSVYQEYYDRASGEGMMSEKQRLELMTIAGEWSVEKDNQIKYATEQLRMDREAKSKMPLPSQARNKQKEIDVSEKKLSELLMQKKVLVGLTTEDFAVKKNNEYYIFRSAYRDTECEKPFFTDEDFDELEDREVDSLIKDYNKSFENLNLKNIQRIAFSLYFQDTFKIAAENPYYFFGKFATELSRFQIELFFEARRFVNMLQSSERPTDDILSDPDKMIEWFDTSLNAKELIKGADGNVSLVGATKQDLKELGLDTGELSLVEKLKLKSPGKKSFSIMDAIGMTGQ